LNCRDGRDGPPPRFAPGRSRTRSVLGRRCQTPSRSSTPRRSFRRTWCCGPTPSGTSPASPVSSASPPPRPRPSGHWSRWCRGGGMGCRISRPGCGGHNRNNKDQHLLIYLMFQNGFARMFHTDNNDVPIRSSQSRFGQFSFGSHFHLLIILSLRYSFVFPFVK